MLQPFICDQLGLKLVEVTVVALKKLTFCELCFHCACLSRCMFNFCKEIQHNITKDIDNSDILILACTCQKNRYQHAHAKELILDFNVLSTA